MITNELVISNIFNIQYFSKFVDENIEENLLLIYNANINCFLDNNEAILDLFDVF